MPCIFVNIHNVVLQADGVFSCSTIILPVGAGQGTGEHVLVGENGTAFWLGDTCLCYRDNK